MNRLILIGAVCALPFASHAAAYGSLNNFDVVNDTGGKCYGFEIELDDLSSTDITYTYNYNHYGVPVITTDKSDPAHPKTFVRYQGKRNPDGSWTGYTNPQDPANPLGATGGHAFTNPGVNLGGEHFGVGFTKPASVVKYHWMVEDPASPGSLILGVVVNISTPVFTYIPPVPNPNPVLPPLVPAQAVVVIPPPPPPPEVPEPELHFGVPVWVKVLKTVQPSGHKINLDELLPLDEVANPGGVPPWQGEIEAPETEVEWMVFQKRPAGDPGGDGAVEAADNLNNGDETVTRRYEFYVYQGSVDPDTGEAQCDNPASCTDLDGNPIAEPVGQFIGAQMAGFNVETPFGLIDQLQEGEKSVAYVDRTLVVGGVEPYQVMVTVGNLPDGLAIDPDTGVLSGTPNAGGVFAFTVEATDHAATHITKAFSLTITEPLAIATAALPDGQEKKAYSITLKAVGGTGPYQWSVDALPNGLDLSPAGKLSGTPTVGSTGTYYPNISVTDSLNQTVAVEFTLTITPAPAAPGDINKDDVVDRADLALILAAVGQASSGPNDPRDLDHDGRITGLDARRCVVLFTHPGGIAPKPPGKALILPKAKSMTFKPVE